MKRLEKLAEQAMINYQDRMMENPAAGPDLSVPSSCYYDGFQDGFKAAREIAASELIARSNETREFDEYDRRIQATADMLMFLAEEIQAKGNEEVE